MVVKPPVVPIFRVPACNLCRHPAERVVVCVECARRVK